MSKILIADDHPMVRSALGYTLRATIPQLEIIEAASQRALEAVLAQHTDCSLVLLDLGIPGARGFSSLLYLRGSFPNLPVAIISAHAGPANMQRAREFGAAGFIPKTAPLEDMRRALEALVVGDQWFPEGAVPAASDTPVELAQRLMELTPQQLKVLTLMADGLLNKQIAYELEVSENTVKVHVSAILRKLGVNSRTQAAVMATALDQADGSDDMDAQSS